MNELSKVERHLIEFAYQRWLTTVGGGGWRWFDESEVPNRAVALNLVEANLLEMFTARHMVENPTDYYTITDKGLALFGAVKSEREEETMLALDDHVVAEQQRKVAQGNAIARLLGKHRKIT